MDFCKGEADFATAEREYAARERTNFDAVCFHAQQCKEIKGWTRAKKIALIEAAKAHCDDLSAPWHRKEGRPASANAPQRRAGDLA